MLEVTQLVVNGLIAGTILAVPAIGITAIYAVLRFPNFAIASIATMGAFAGCVANVRFGLSALAATGFAFVVAGGIGVVSDEFVLKPIRKTGCSRRPSHRSRSPSRWRTSSVSYSATICAATT